MVGTGFIGVVRLREHPTCRDEPGAWMGRANGDGTLATIYYHHHQPHVPAAQTPAPPNEPALLQAGRRPRAPHPYHSLPPGLQAEADAHPQPYILRLWHNAYGAFMCRYSPMRRPRHTAYPNTASPKRHTSLVGRLCPQYVDMLGSTGGRPHCSTDRTAAPPPPPPPVRTRPPTDRTRPRPHDRCWEHWAVWLRAAGPPALSSSSNRPRRPGPYTPTRISGQRPAARHVTGPPKTSPPPRTAGQRPAAPAHAHAPARLAATHRPHPATPPRPKV